MRTPAILLTLVLATPALAALPEAKPETLGFDPSRLARVEDAIARAVGEKKVPGAVVVVGRRGKVALAKAFGRRSVEPIDEPMTRDTVFDMASLTKPIATATSVMVLLERGRFRLGDRVVNYLPELKGKRQGRDHDRSTAPAPLGPDPRRPDLGLRRRAGVGLAEDRRVEPSGAARREVSSTATSGSSCSADWSRRSRASRSTSSPGRRSSTRWGWSTPASVPSGGRPTSRRPSPGSPPPSGKA